MLDSRCLLFKPRTLFRHQLSFPFIQLYRINCSSVPQSLHRIAFNLPIITWYHLFLHVLRSFFLFILNSQFSILAPFRLLYPSHYGRSACSAATPPPSQPSSSVSLRTALTSPPPTPAPPNGATPSKNELPSLTPAAGAPAPPMTVAGQVSTLLISPSLSKRLLPPKPHRSSRKPIWGGRIWAPSRPPRRRTRRLRSSSSGGDLVWRAKPLGVWGGTTKLC